MRHLLALLLTAVAWSSASQQDASVAFTNVGVLPMDRETVLANQTVVVRGGRIAEIGPASSIKVSDDAVRVDGSGKFLMPTLGEMHGHIPGGSNPEAVVERTLALYALNGVGVVRGMLGDPRHLTYRDKVSKNEILSPRIFTSGPSLNGKSVPDVASGVQTVASQKAAGYDLLKIHPGVQRDVFDALAKKADEVGIRFAGHVPLDVGLARALEAKFWTIDHLDGYMEALAKNPMQSEWFGVNLMDQVDESKIPALVKATKAAGTWMVPTESLLYNSASDEDPEAMARWPEMTYARPEGVVQQWVSGKKNFMTRHPAPARQRFIDVRRKLIKALHDGGVPFALGSDAPQTWNVPGFSVHRELKAIVAAGLTPYQALRSGTVNVATLMGIGASGTVARGQRADLILLEANPLQDIGNSSSIAGVMLNGRWLSKADIEKRLAALP